MKSLASIVVTLALLSAACGPPHISPFTPRNRAYEPGKYAANAADAKPSNGSIFSEAAPGLLQDTRAIRAGDIVVVKIDEQAEANGDATTKLSKSTNKQAGMDGFIGLLPAIKKAYPDIDPAKLLAISSQSDFSGDGQTARKGALTGSISVRVREQMPNADLFIEGTKVVMINHEEYHLYISGLIRSADIARDNSVESSRIADAQVEFTGRGDVEDTIDRGWLTKILDSINPF
jgi:flagellar L-ring protein precursor FlgH